MSLNRSARSARPRVTGVVQHSFRHSRSSFQVNTRMKATAKAVLLRDASCPETSAFLLSACPRAHSLPIIGNNDFAIDGLTNK